MGPLTDPAFARILIVEDDAAQRGLVDRVLTLAGFTTRTVEGLAGARQALRGARFDLVLGDYDLGQETIAELVDEGLLEARRLVVVTGRMNVPPCAGAVVLRKPVSPDELVDLLRDLIPDPS